MARLDARVKTELPAWISSQSGGEEQKTTIRELSLSSLLIDNKTNKYPETLFIRITLPKGSEVKVFGNIVRSFDFRSAVQFYFPEQAILKELWEIIKDRIQHFHICPYCDHKNQSYAEHCNNCSLYINFRDQHYLEKHLQETFLWRITGRMSRLKSDHMQRVLNFIDREILTEKGLPVDEQFVGTSRAMLEVFSMIRKVAPTENAVLILGESGTGKDLAAKAIHERSQRKSGPFVIVNCTAIPEGLLEAELFGYEKGAFTGAYMSRKGKFELAQGGTVFLDEVAELPLSLQAKLLRVLEDKTVERLGGKSGKKVDVRVLTATNKNLAKEVDEGRFRLDLYHRINTFTITLPPLRDRGEDKEIIAQFYLKKFCLQEGLLKQFSKNAIRAINLYSWPGNVRELINKVRRAIVVSNNDMITPADLSMEVIKQIEISPLKEMKADLEKQNLIDVLHMTSNNISRASKLLGISRPTVYALIKKHDLQFSKSLDS